MLTLRLEHSGVVNMSVHIFAVVMALVMILVVAGSLYLTAMHFERKMKKEQAQKQESLK